jgi:quercetin 2,3-dioxygenase
MPGAHPAHVGVRGYEAASDRCTGERYLCRPGRSFDTHGMSGPVSVEDADAGAECGVAPAEFTLEITPSREARIDGQTVRRALPRKGRRTVGAWCFADHIGPSPIDESSGLGIGPHPHIGLQTVTWLLAGEILHRDSLGFEQSILPGQLNLMTAGNGVSHAEESPPGAPSELHGIQLWRRRPVRHGRVRTRPHPGRPNTLGLTAARWGLAKHGGERSHS